MARAKKSWSSRMDVSGTKAKVSTVTFHHSKTTFCSFFTLLAYCDPSELQHPIKYNMISDRYTANIQIYITDNQIRYLLYTIDMYA